MTTPIVSNSSLSSNSSFRKEINEFINKVNFINILVQLFLVVIGLLGNLLALIVINRKSLRNTSSAVFITYMAIFDSGVLLLHATTFIRPRRNLFLHCLLTYLTDFFPFCANWVSVIFTLERCIAVSSPFLAKRYCTVRSARISVFILIATALIILSSASLVTLNIDDRPNRRKCLIRQHFRFIRITFEIIIIYGIPDLLLLSNFFTLYVLFKRRKKEKRLSDATQSNTRVYDVNSNRKQLQLTIMLVTVNLAFYLFQTPTMISFICEYTPPKHLDVGELKRLFVFSQMSVVILQLNHVTDFIFYCLTGQRFRQATVETFHILSKGAITFYHRYILCNKDYRPSITSQYQPRSHLTTLHTSNPEIFIRPTIRKSTI